MCEYRTIDKKQHRGTRCPLCLSDYLRGSDRKTTEDIAGEYKVFMTYRREMLQFQSAHTNVLFSFILIFIRNMCIMVKWRI